jgi:hypothetical protein
MRTTQSCLVRLALVLAIGCVVITHGDQEEAGVRSLDEYDDADYQESEIESQATEEDTSMNDFNINSEDQEDRIGGVAAFDDDEPSKPKVVHHAKPEDTMQDELKAIQGNGDIGESNDPGAGGSVEETKIAQEGGTDQAVSDSQKSAAKLEAEKKKEAERLKKEAEQKALDDQRQATVDREKAEAKKKADQLERQLQKARDDAAKEAKEEEAREVRDKADAKKVQDARAKEKEGKKVKEDADAKVFRQKEIDEKVVLKKDADEAREREMASAKERTRKQSEAGSKSQAKIKEHGEKAYDKELSLEAGQKAEELKKQEELDKAHTAKERAEKNAADAESSEKINEQQTKSNEREEKLEKVSKVAQSAAEKANKDEDREGAAKAQTQTLYEDLYRHQQAVAVEKSNEENSQKEVLKAYTDNHKKIATKHEKLMKTRLSAATSKENEAKLQYKKSKEARETVGKGAREMSKKAAEKAQERLTGLISAKKIAEDNLVQARRAKAQVNKEHAIESERTDKEFANKADTREKGLKTVVEKAEKKAEVEKKNVEKMSAVAKKASEAEKKTLEKEVKFNDGHYEKFEKQLELSKQKVTQWIDEDEVNEKKLAKMRAWEITKKNGIEKAATDEGKAKADESSTKAKIESNQKQVQENKEKVDMDERLKEGMQKVDEEMVKADEKETKKAKADEQAAQDKKMAAEEKATKQDERVEKAKVMEKERGEKEDEASEKAASKKSSDEEMKAQAEKLALTIERQGKRNVVLKAALKASEIKSKDVQNAYLQAGSDEGAQKRAEQLFEAAKSQVLKATTDEKAYKEKMDKDEKQQKSLKADEEKLKKEKADADKKTEGIKKKELEEKEVEKNAQEESAKDKIKAVADARALQEQKEAAAEQAIKQKRAAERSAKDMVAAKAKEEEEAMRLKKENDITQELATKKMQAEGTLITMEADEKTANEELTTADDTLAKREEKHKEWKITLSNRRKTEKEDREKELKVIPMKNKLTSYQKYQDNALAKRKISQGTQAHYDTIAAAHLKANNTKNEKMAINMGLEAEKKDYEKRLLVELMRDVKQQNKYKKIDEQNLKDNEMLSQKHALREAFIQQRAELVQRLKDEAAEAKEVKEKEESDTTLFKLEEVKLEEPAAGSAAMSTQDLLDQRAANSKEAGDKREAKAAVAQEKLDKIAAVEQANEDKKGKFANDIAALAREIKEAKGEVTQRESDLKVGRKDDAKRLKNLRDEERITKLKEIKLKRELLDVSEKEEGLRSEKLEIEELNRDAQGKKTRAFDKEKLAAEIVEKGKSNQEAYTAKKTALSMEVQSVQEKLATAQKADELAKAEADRGKEEKEAADASRDSSLSERNKAAEKEKASKNDAMEKTKKSEASAIQRAVERKNKAGESSEKAYQHKSELQDKQLVKAKRRHSQIVESLDNIMSEKNALSKRYQIPDEFAVKEEEERGATALNTAEISAKKASTDADKAVEEQAAANQEAAQSNIKLDDSRAKLKTAQGVLEQSERANEGAQKAKTLVKQEAEKTAAAKKATEAEAEVTAARKQLGVRTDELDATQRLADRAERAKNKATKAVADAREEKIASKKDETSASRSQENFMKVAERFRTLTGQLEERETKRTASSTQVASDEKAAKLAQDEFKNEHAKCAKLKDAGANVGKAFAQLQKQMQEWSHKNPWLKQKSEEAKEGDEIPTDPDPDVGAGLGDVEPIYNEPVEGATAAPQWARRSFLTLLQEDYGTDVRAILRSR